MRLTKIYTKIGDGGTTLLASGEKVSKGDLRIEAYGTVDELNAVLGMLRDVMNSHSSLTPLCTKLTEIQNNLFDLGAELSMLPGKFDMGRLQLVSEASVRDLENQIDAMN